MIGLKGKFAGFGQAWTGFPLIAMKPPFLKGIIGKVSRPVQLLQARPELGFKSRSELGRILLSRLMRLGF